jgi:hypothetical protein
LTITELEKLAASNSKLPEGLTAPEQLYFLQLRILHREYKAGMTKEQCVKEKRELLKTYERNKFYDELLQQNFEKYNRLSHHLTEIVKTGCPMCKKAVAIFDGAYRGLSEEKEET